MKPETNEKLTRPETTLCIGLTGAFASGCTESAEYLRDEQDFFHVSLSEIIKNQFQIKGKRSRETMQDLGNQIRNERGPQILMKLAIDKILEKQEGQPNRVVIEAIRNPFEIEHLITTVPNAYIVALYASQEERIRRDQSESEKRRQKFIKADLRDSGENEPEYGQQVVDCVNMAHYFIDNSGTEPELKSELRNFFEIISGRKEHEPEREEVMMSHAFMQRLFSKCLSRSVGAVISRGHNIVSTGSNGVSRGREHCRSCHRKVVRKCTHCGADLLEGLGKCSKCKRLDRDRKKVLEKHLDLCYAVHAEERAILSAGRDGLSVSGATLYCTAFPCLLCSKMIVESGIKKVVYVEPYPSAESEEILKAGEVQTERFKGFTAHHLYRVSSKGRMDDA